MNNMLYQHAELEPVQQCEHIVLHDSHAINNVSACSVLFLSMTGLFQHAEIF